LVDVDYLLEQGSDLRTGFAWKGGVDVSKQITISDSVFERLQRLAVPLVDTPESVVIRLLNFYEPNPVEEDLRIGPSAEEQTKTQSTIDGVLERLPRQKGIIVRLDETTVEADKLSDLYIEALKYLDKRGLLNKVNDAIPIATSSKRYLIAKSPVHPQGNDFRIPVEYKGYYMEAHKDYKEGIRHLCKMLNLCGVTLTYVG
jgi:hypothetical protein